jgi:hypothetical protein
MLIENLIKKIQTLKADAIVFFTPGGWGNITSDKEAYAKSLLVGIQKILKSWQYKTMVINYPRTGTGILGKIKSLKETLLAFPSESKKLADLIEVIATHFRNLKIILVGYSLGGAFINEVMKKIKEKERIYGIEAGTPFFYKKIISENILHLDNGGKDALSKRNMKKLVLIGILGILKLILLFKLIRLKISEAFHFKEHEYFWENPEIKLKVENFLKNNLLKHA